MLHPTLDQLFNTELMPHGMCFVWLPPLMWLHGVSDALIAISYYSIPFALGYFVWRRKDLAFPSVFVLFGIFIMACGTTHLIAIWTLWFPDYWIDGGVKAVTAVASVGTAIVLWRTLPAALALPNRGLLVQANRALESEIAERERAERDVRNLNASLEERVRLRTADLEAANLRLRATLQDKQILLQELHHRVKNNLQVVSSLLTMEGRNAGPAVASALRESIDRVRTMARVHEQLQRSEGAGGFDLREYLTKLCSDLAQIYSWTAGRASCHVHHDGLPLRTDFDTATPLVLIVNEVLSNIFKHAFSDGRYGNIYIRLEASGTVTRLTIEDDGVGLPADFEAGRRRSTGMQLVTLLAQQIEAAMQYSRIEKGTRFTLIIPTAHGHDLAAA